MSFIPMKPGTLLSPVPAALIGSGAEGPDGPVQNLMTAAWAGTVCSDPPMVSVSVRPSRYTYELIEKSGEFVISLTDRKLLRAADYCGVRSGRDEPGAVQKVYYQENVYRVAGYSRSFREIMQAGVECIGAVDHYQLAEAVTLAAESLRRVSGDSVLALSHLGAAGRLIRAAGLSGEAEKEALAFLSRKSAHELKALCAREGAPADAADRLAALTALSGTPDEVLPRLSALGCAEEAEELRLVTDALAGTQAGRMIRLDFSVVNDPAYYNGLVFQGYVGGIPERVIAGGQYDQLMRKMGRTSRAVGFAVYLDTLERLEEPSPPDADVLLLYPEGMDARLVFRAVSSLQKEGLSVSAQLSRPDKRRFGRTAILTESGEIRYDA